MLGSGKPVAKRKPREDAMWGPAKPVKKTAKRVSADARKKAQAGRLSAAERRKVTERDKEKLRRKKAAISKRKFKESM